MKIDFEPEVSTGQEINFEPEESPVGVQGVIRATPVEGGSFQAGGINGAPVVPAGGATDPQVAQDPSFFRSAADATQRATYGGLAGLARVFQGAIPENATSPTDIEVRRTLGNFANELTQSSRQATEYYGVDPQAKDLRSQVGRGVGTFAAAGPLLATGGVGGLAAGAGQMGATTYNEAFQAAKEEGKTDAQAQDKAVGEAAKTLPQLAAYMIGGKIAGAAAGKLAEAAGPALKGLVGAGAATASNVAVGTITRALEGHDWKPTAENLTMDALFGMLHGYGEFAGASKEVKARAAEELRDRGIPEEIVAPVEVQGRSTPSPEEKTPVAAPQEASRPVPEVVVPEAEIKVTPEGVTDLTTGEPISPVREQSLKSLGKIPSLEEMERTQQEQRAFLEANLPPGGREELSKAVLEPVTIDTFERVSGEKLEPGNVPYRDPETAAVFQVPEGTQRKDLEQILETVRANEKVVQDRIQRDKEALLESQKPTEKAPAPLTFPEELSAEQRKEFNTLKKAGWIEEKLPSGNRRLYPTPEGAADIGVSARQGALREQGIEDTYFWNNPVRLRNLRDEMISQDKKAKAGTLTVAGQKIPPNPRHEVTIKEINDRIEELMNPKQPEVVVPPPSLRPEEPVQPYERVNEPPPEVSGRQIEPPVEEAPVSAEPISEPPAPKELQPEAQSVPTSIKNAVVDQERAARNLPPLMEAASKTIGASWEEAMNRINSDPEYQSRLIASLEEAPRALNDVDTAVLLHRQVELQNAYDRELRKISEAYDAGNEEVAAAAKTNQLKIAEEYDKLTQLERLVGTEQGRALRFRQTMVNEDFSLARMELKMRAEKNGAPLTEAESKQVKELHDKIAATQDAFDKYRLESEEKIARLEFDKAHKKLVSRVGVEKAPPKAKVNQWLRNKAEEARQRIKARRDQGQAFSGGINLEVIDDYIVIGASKIADGIGNFSQWSKDMVTEFGEAIRPHLKTIFDKAGAAVKTAPKVATNEEQRTRIVEGMKARVADGATVNELGRYIQGLAENAVRGGVKDRETLVKSVHEFVKPLLPDVTPREIQDAISGYGKFTPLSKDEVNTTLRDLKGQLQQVSKIEDLQKKIAPRKTGQERREKSVEERRLERMVNELKKKGGYNVTDPEKQLKSSIAAQERSLSNAIRDLAEEIDLGQPEPKRGAPPTNEKIETLKALLARMRQTREELYGAKTREMTDEQRVRNAVQAAERMTAEYERQVQQEDFARKKGKPLLSTPELEAARKRRDAARAERDELKALADEIANPKLTPDQRYLKAVKARLKTETAKLQERLAKGDFEPRKKREVPPDPELLKIRAENTLAKEAYLKALFDARMAARPTWKKIAGGIGETLNTSRAVLTAFDLSAVLRQGGFIALGNPARAAKSLGSMFRALRSEKGQHEVMEAIRMDPDYVLAQKAKLFLSDESAPSLTKMEEAYASRWASKIPGVAASGRAYSTFLNKLRFDSFKALKETLTRTGTPTPQEAAAIANYINVATGRGSVHQSLAQTAAALNMVFFAPRYVTSRFQLLTLQPFYGGSARTRKLVLHEYAKFLTGAAIVTGLGLTAGGQLNTDSKSSDFLKLKFGDTRLDLLSGLIQASTLISREAQGKTTNNRGEVLDLTKYPKGPYDPSRGSVGARFLRTKLAPVPGTIVSLSYGEDLGGEKFGPKEAAINSVVPISFGDIYKVMEEQGVPKGTIFSILSLFGAGVQTYDEKKATGKPRDIFSSREKRDIFAK